MNYPSLLYTYPATGKVLEYSVFEDLKLDLLLSGEAIAAMQKLCDSRDIAVRQELLSSVFQSENRLRFKKLAEVSSDIYRLGAAFKTARCENEKYYLYVNLMRYVSDFCSKAAGLTGSGVLIERFSSFFKDLISGERYKKLYEDTHRLAPASERVRITACRIRGENLCIRDDDDTTIVARLQRCAVSLGLPQTRETRDVAIRLNPRIINALGALRPDDFAAFRDFYGEYEGFFDEDILKYRIELNFCLEVSRLFDKVRSAGIPVCLPAPSSERKIKINGLRDISLLAKNETNIVPNDMNFNEDEPFFYLTGANGGGKTTYLRSIGIAVILFLSGCPVPCDKAEIYPPKCVFTHFPRDERFEGEGRFADEVSRVESILAEHEGKSLVLLNETYSTTSEEAAIELTAKLAQSLYESGSFGLYITHQHGIGETKIPFLSVIIDESDENRRTYKIARRRGVSGSFAQDILKKYGLTAEGLYERLTKQRAVKKG